MNTAVAKADPQTTLPAVATPMEMLDRALSTGATPETLEKLLNLQERWEKGQAKKAYDDAMANAKAEFPPILKDKHVSYGSAGGFRHETLHGIAKLIDPILSKHGLSYRFRTASDATTVTITCIVSHRLGHSEENTLGGPHDKSGGKNSIQAVGSTVSYLQRYTLKGALGLSAADDDDAKLAGVGDLITDEQADEIRNLVNETKADLPKFLQWVGAESIADIPVKKFADAKARLETKKRAQA